MRLTDELEASPVLPTGIPGLDRILSGGFALHRIAHVSGPESAGKSTLMLQLIAETQRNGGSCVYVDMEHALDPPYAEALGVDMRKLLISQPEHAEQALDIVHNMVCSKEVSLIVLDSIATLTPKREMEGDVSHETVGLLPRLLGRSFRMIAPLLKEAGTALVCTNQIRMEIGGPGGSRETWPGGRAAKHFPSQRLDLRRLATLSNNGTGEATGIKVKAHVQKNKIGAPYRKVELDLDFGEGFSRAASLLDEAVTEGLIAYNQPMYTIEEKKYRGRDQAKSFLSENPSTMDTLQAKLGEKHERPKEESPKNS
jgi:recombination protein RecA